MNIKPSWTLFVGMVFCVCAAVYFITQAMNVSEFMTYGIICVVLGVAFGLSAIWKIQP